MSATTNEVAAANRSTSPLSEAQIAAFRRDGFIRIETLTDMMEIASLRLACDELFARQAGFEVGDRLELNRADGRKSLPQIVNPERYAPAIVAGVAFRNALGIARQLLGSDCVPTGNHAIVKPAFTGAETPWHQDEAYWDPRYEHDAISVWLALQPATIDNGCMQFVPGSHLGPVLPHVLVEANAHGLRLSSLTTLTESVVCELAAGGATVHAGRTIHYAGPNRTDTPRRALVFGFGRPPQRLAAPQHYPWQRPEWFAVDY